MIFKFPGRSLATGLCLLISGLQAMEFREPTTVSHGPLRYFFEEPADTFAFRWWSALYSKYANRAYNNEHGRNLEQLPALLFNESDFRVAHIFQNCLVRHENQYYNPLLRTARLRLRADYQETGAVFGARFDYPFNSSADMSGRVGVRISVPLKRCKMDKWDEEGARDGAQLQDVFARQPATPIDLAGTGIKTSDESLMIRLDLLEALSQSSDRNSFMIYKTSNPANQVQAGGNAQIDANIDSLIDASRNQTDVNSFTRDRFALIYSPEGLIPRADVDSIITADSVAAVAGLGAAATISTPQQASSFPSDASISEGGFYVFDQAKVQANPDFYKNLADDSDSLDVATRKVHQANKATVWAIPFKTHTLGNFANTFTLLGARDGGTLRTAEKLTAQITENVYEWLHDRGMTFETFTTDDFGDVQADAFFEAGFNENATFEACVSVVFPTGGKTKYKNNPYQIYPGNGGHWEVGGGALMAYRFGTMFNVKADARYHWVLNESEERAATFKGSGIKNIGPQTNADVKWEYFVGNVDLNFTHPGTHTITATLGYQLYYKREEKIKYPKSTMTSWLGQRFRIPDTGTTITPKQWLDDPQELDANLASAHTNAISHRARLEASYLLSDWLEFFWGGAWTFAGRNCPYTIDGHAGFNMAF